MDRFLDGERICFVGDSIVRKGLYIKQIVAYYRKSFPNERAEFYNCGVPGGDLGNALKIFDEDVAIYDPTHIVLMLGVNDSRFQHLKGPAEERYALLLKAYETYRANVEAFYQLTVERGIKLTLCTPVPYAEYADFDTPTVRGAYALMLGYASFIRAFALEKGLQVCDCHAEMTKAMQSAVLFAPDRVHPTEEGHLALARAILAAQGLELSAPQECSEELDVWYDVTQRIRNIVAAEFFLVPNYTERSDEERIETVKRRLEDAKNGGKDPGEYLRRMMDAHVNDKPRQRELVEFVKSFMKR